ncbi:MAG: SPOR domain-containing protein [Bacteroidota bacterium]|nr:SPOR domain-containing protein [Bacteroidota bacterium]
MGSIVRIILLCLINSLAYAQYGESGSLRVHQDKRIDTLLHRHIEINKRMAENPNHDGIAGYRIQIFFDSGNNSKARALEVIEEFTKDYPEVGAYLTFGEPFYRVRVGDFRRKIEALGFMDKIGRKYPNAWIIKDKIKFPGKEKSKTNEYDKQDLSSD